MASLDGFGFGSSSGNVVFNYITDATIITTITTNSNWDDDGNYTGSTSGLNAGDIYIDSTNKLRYEFDGTTLMRNALNNVIL